MHTRKRRAHDGQLRITERRQLVLAVAVLLQLVSGSALAANVGSAQVAPQPNGTAQSSSHRRELVFLDVRLGATYVDPTALKDGDLLDSESVKSGGFGIAYGAALGVRMQDLTLAAWYRVRDLSDWQLRTFGGEAALSFTLGRFSPHFGFGGGYAALTGTVADIRGAGPFPAAPAVDITGLNVQVHAGLDYYLLDWFSVGADLTGEAFFLRRKGDHLPRTSSVDPYARSLFPYGRDGTGNGLGAALSLVLGLHH